MRFALVDLPPAIRAQAEAKLLAAGTVRTNRIARPADEAPISHAPTGRKRGRPVGSRDRVPRVRRGQSAPPVSEGTARLLWHIRAEQLLEPVREWRFDQNRKWRFDLAWPIRLLACEIEGLTHDGGRHQRIAGYTADVRKYNAALLLGWRVLRVTTDMVRRGEAVELIRQALAKFPDVEEA